VPRKQPFIPPDYVRISAVVVDTHEREHQVVLLMPVSGYGYTEKGGMVTVNGTVSFEGEEATFAYEDKP